MDILFQDIRYALRVLARNPGVAATAIWMVGLGIAANATVFSWINATILDPVPGARRTGELVTVMRGERSDHPTPPLSYPDYADLRERTTTFSGLLAHHEDFFSITDAGKPERVYGALVSANYFEVLGVQPILGSVFLRAEEEKPGQTPSVVISYGLWQRHFGGDRQIVGKPVHINQKLCTIVAVTPPAFHGCVTGLQIDLWAPLVYRGAQLTDRGSEWLNVLGRLRPGVGARQAEAELDLQMRRIVEQFPDSHRQPNQITLDPLWRSPFGANVYLFKILPMLLALALVLLLLACANVANLLLVHAVVRRREMAIRVSLGAGRLRLFRQVVVQALLLAFGGGAVATLVTVWTGGTLASFIPPSTLPIAINGHMNASVILACFVASLGACVIVGMVPAIRSSQLDPARVLKEEGGGLGGGLHRSPLAASLVVAQIALSLLLLVCAGLFTRSLQNAERQEPGFDPDGVLLASYDLGATAHARTQNIAFSRDLLARLKALPGVAAVTLADFSPLSFTIHTDIVQPDGYVPQPRESLEVSRGRVGPNYFHTMRTALHAGRDFSSQDTPTSARVAIVNQAFVDRYWPGQDAIGKRVATRGQSFTVVGIAQNAKYRQLVYPAEPVVFLPLFQDFDESVIIHVRSAGDGAGIAQAVEKTVHLLNPELPLFNVTTVASSMKLGSLFERVAGVFASAFGMLALLIAAVGLYSVVAYATRQRTREIGLRMALGARPQDVWRLVLNQGVRLAAVGLATGLALCLAFGRFLRGVLFGVTETDPATILGVSLVLGVAALTACYLPARRAAKANPLVALRHD
jgi:predicted permease